MKQPKFKFGDKVKSLSGKVFDVNQIRFNQTFSDYDYYDYNQEHAFAEDRLELYKEPKPKKLYAYQVLSSKEIIFKTEETFIQATDKDRAGVDAINWEFIQKRLPEYDIELPLSKASSAI